MSKNKNSKKSSYSSSTGGNGKKDTGIGRSYHSKDGGSSNNSHGSSNSGSKPMSIPGKAGSGVKNDENDNKIGIYSPEARGQELPDLWQKKASDLDQAESNTTFEKTLQTRDCA